MSKLEKLTLKQIGTVKSSHKKVCIGLDSQNKDIKLDERIALQQEMETGVSEIVVDEEYEDCLDGIEDFSHVVVCFLTDIPEDARQLKKVHPGGSEELPLKGIFACRSPVRPNPLGLSTVKLLERKGNVLVLQGFDAIDGTAVIDIKPHIPAYDAPPDAKMAQWVHDFEHLWVKRIKEFKGGD